MRAGEGGPGLCARRPTDRPSVLSDVLYLSISHATDIVLFAISRHAAVGVDVERVRPNPDVRTLVQDCFSEHEQIVWRLLPEDERQEAFFRAWTRKEAVRKAMGVGLAFSPERVEVTYARNEPARLVRIDHDVRRSQAWSLAPLYPSAGYVGAVAHGQKRND